MKCRRCRKTINEDKTDELYVHLIGGKTYYYHQRCWEGDMAIIRERLAGGEQQDAQALAKKFLF
jgi:hypothetical protein